MAVQAFKTTARKVGETSIVLTRFFAAARETVYTAWTDPVRVAAWWGPKDFTNPVCEMDVRPGGTYRIVMRGPDGVEYPCKGAYLEVLPNERIVMTDDCSEHPDAWHDLIDPDRKANGNAATPDAVTTVDFEAVDGGTRVTIRMAFATEAIRDAHVRIGMNDGWAESFVRLDSLLAAGADSGTGDREFVLSRKIDAAPGAVFQAWTRAEYLAQWWGPDGFTTTTDAMDFREGGDWIFTMHGPDGKDYANAIRYQEIVPDTRIVYAHGEKTDGPVLFHSTVTFVAEGPATRVTLRLLFPTAEARDVTVRESGAAEGGKQTLGRLAAFVEQAAQ